MNSERKILKKTKKDYNLIADHFSSTRKYPWKNLEFLFKDIPEGGKVLDLGCGNGRFYEFLKEKNIEYVGIDKAEKLIEKARKKYPEADFRMADALDLPFENNYFDFVISIAVFHHMPSEKIRLKFLNEARRVLKSGGKLKLSVWDLLSTDKRIYLRNPKEKLTGKIGIRDILLPWKNDKGEVATERYYHAFKKKELEKLAEKAELKNIEVFEKGEKHKSTLFLFAKK